MCCVSNFANSTLPRLITCAIFFVILTIALVPTGLAHASEPAISANTATMTAPNGDLIAPGCAFGVQNGAVVLKNNTVVNKDGSKETIDTSTCHHVQPPSYSGYVEDGDDLLSSSSNPIYSAYSYWTVPSNSGITCSQSASQLFFLWNGLEPNGTDLGNEILQPVLAHGYDGPLGSCNFWLSVWYGYGPSNNYVWIYTTSAATLTAGDSIFGYMHYLGTYEGSCCWWYVQLSDNTASISISETIPTSSDGGYSAMRWYFGGVLEANADITACADYPGGSSGVTDFTTQYLADSSGTQITPSWNKPVTSGTPQCSFSVSTTSTAVDLDY
jgi:hypothetical protein